jgi:uncharacterized protein (TIRG00374 family)
MGHRYILLGISPQTSLQSGILRGKRKCARVKIIKVILQVMGKSIRRSPSWISTNNSAIKFIAGIFIGAIFLYFSFRNVNINEMVNSLSKANYWYILLSIFILMFSHYLRALRWQLFLAPIKTINSRSLFSALVIGYAANTFVPAHLGDFLRAFVLGKRHNIFASKTFASIVLERIVDILSLILVMFLVILVHPFPNWVVQSGLIMLAGSICLFITLIILKLSETKTTRLIHILFKPLPEKIGNKINSLILHFLSGVMPLKSFWHYFYVAIFSVAIWFCYALVYYFCLQAFSLEEIYNLAWYVGLVVLVITTISIVVPTSPGYVGTYHYLCQISLVMFGVSATDALSYASIAHAISILPVTLVGLIMANYEGVAIYRTASESKRLRSMR